MQKFLLLVDAKGHDVQESEAPQEAVGEGWKIRRGNKVGFGTLEIFIFLAIISSL